MFQQCIIDRDGFDPIAGVIIHTFIVIIGGFSGIADGQLLYFIIGQLNIAAVQAEKLLHMDLAQSVQFRNKVQEARAGGFWRQTAVFGDGSDGSAGCDQKNLFQISSSVHRKM